jgi:hypothetical protein
VTKQQLHVLKTVTAPDPVSVMPLRLQFDDADTPIDVLDALSIAPFVGGELPAARTANLKRLRKEAALMPAGATVIRVAQDGPRKAVLTTGDGWMLLALRWADGARVTVTAINEEVAERVLTEAIDDAEEPETQDATIVNMGFWYFDSCSRRRVREIAAPTWPEIRANYTAGVATAFDRLVATTADDLAGRLLLLHGPPGTGKTTVLRAIARSWRDWCQVDCVLDPERLFGDPAYLIEVAIGMSNDDEKPWRLLLLEDCDELIRGEAKASTGQALSRLLNLTDGLLGQGTQTLIGITTNENLARLHPAVTTPGRCLAQIEVGPLTQAEAGVWLGGAGVAPSDGATLAELYSIREGTAPLVAETQDQHANLYL